MSTSEPSFGDKIWKKLQGKKLRPLERDLLRRTLLALDSDTTKGGTPDEIAQNSTRQAFLPGEPVFEAGSPGDTIYILLDGEVDIELRDRVIETLRPGEVFGEIAVLTGVHRTATVRATEKTVVLCIPAVQVDETLRGRLWDYAAERRFVNLRGNPERDMAARQTWYLQARHSTLEEGSEWETDADWIFLYAGRLQVDEHEVDAPALISGGHIRALADDTRVAILPPPPSQVRAQQAEPMDLGRFR